MHGSRLLAAIAIAASFLVCPQFAFSQNHPGLDAPGFQQNRDYFSQMPFEHIDTLSGSWYSPSPTWCYPATPVAS